MDPAGPDPAGPDPAGGVGATQRDRAVAALAAAIATGDAPTIEACTEKLLAPQVSWRGAPAGICSSRDEVVAVLRSQLDEGMALRLVELHPVGDQVLLHMELRPGAGDVLRLDARPWRVVLTFDVGGSITHMQDYASAEVARRDMALRAHTLAPSPAADGRVTGLVPFVQVADVAASATFYGLLGFAVDGRHHLRSGVLDWAGLAAGDARLMLARAAEPVVPEEQAVLFYLYSADLAGLRDRLVTAGVQVGEILDGSPGPSAEMRVTDPDGYALMIAQLDA